jgi:hypothetical protein
VSSDESQARVPSTDDVRAGLRREVDADALAHLFLLVDPAMRQLLLSLVQRQSQPRSHLIEAVRSVLGDPAAGQVAAHGAQAVWIEFPDAEQNRFWRQALALPNA